MKTSSQSRQWIQPLPQRPPSHPTPSCPDSCSPRRPQIWSALQFSNVTSKTSEGSRTVYRLWDCFLHQPWFLGELCSCDKITVHSFLLQSMVPQDGCTTVPLTTHRERQLACFQFGAIIKLWWKLVYGFLWQYKFLFLWDRCPGMQSLSCRMIMFSLRNCWRISREEMNF